MFLTAYQTYYQTPELTPFFSRGFGMRLLSVLYEASMKKNPLGISEAHALMTPPKPQYATFRQFIGELEAQGLVIYEAPEPELSKQKVLRLSHTVYRLIDTLEAQLFEQTLIERAGMG